MKKLAVFDVDGTLLDTIEGIRYFLVDAMRKSNIERAEDLSLDVCRKYLGYGSKYLLDSIFKFLNIEGEGLYNEVFKLYHEEYEANSSYLVKPYAGISTLLEELKSRGYILVAYSNKPDIVLQPLMELMFPKNIFSFIQGQKEGFEPKPNPKVLEFIIEKFSLKNEEVFYIGDSEVDIRTGKNAGVKTVAVTWGFRDKKDLKFEEPDYLVDSIEELRHILI